LHTFLWTLGFLSMSPQFLQMFFFGWRCFMLYIWTWTQTKKIKNKKNTHKLLWWFHILSQYLDTILRAVKTLSLGLRKCIWTGCNRGVGLCAQNTNNYDRLSIGGCFFCEQGRWYKMPHSSWWKLV
jgi:hypothetical protein